MKLAIGTSSWKREDNDEVIERRKGKEDLRVDEDHVFGEHQTNYIVSVSTIDRNSAIARAEDVGESL
jgi:hypothetical protein